MQTNHIMKTIKIFLASSEEMDYDRMAFGNLVRRLDDVYEKRGVRVKLFEWEDYDSAYNDKRKQDEYNEKVRESDIFLALFHKKAGEFTVEEFDKASEAFREKASPKVYTFLKDIKPGEEPTPQLEAFKKRLFEEMGHYWCRYDNRDSLHLQFVMQLQLVESSLGDSVQVEDGNVCIDGLKVASMDRLRFAAANEDYVKMSEELASLPGKIEKARLRLEKLPDDEDLQDDLQQKLDRYNKLKEDFAEYQKLLFNTAKRIAQLQGQRVTDRMRRAMDAFNEGNVREANIILEEAEADARHNLDDYKQSKEITEQKRQNVIASIEELLLKTSTVMADASIPIEERINQTDKIYAQAIEMAEVIDYNEREYSDLLMDYGCFLWKHSHFEHAFRQCSSALSMLRHIFGEDHPQTATSYYFIGLLLYDFGDYSKALEYTQKSLEIRVRILDNNHYQIANSYSVLGSIYKHQGDHSTALEYYLKALNIRNKVFGNDHPDISASYNEIGRLYYEMGDDTKAIEYYSKALDIDMRLLGSDHLDTSVILGNIGGVYFSRGDYSNAKDYITKAVDIQERVTGRKNATTAISYCNLGLLYHDLEDYEKALDYSLRALDIQKNALTGKHLYTAISYNCVGASYEKLGNLDKALEYRTKAMEILESLYGPEHKDVVFIKGKIDEIRNKMNGDQ